MRTRRAVATLAAIAVPLFTTPAMDPVQVGWTWPLGYADPVIVRAFDPPAEPWQTGHRGVDLAGIDGQSVYASGDGVVTYAGLVAGVGVVTVIHGELRTTYQPVAAAVRAGEFVETGQQIGTLNRAGSHCAPSPCLHWGLLRGSDYLDPTSLIPPGGLPRLLPLGADALDQPHQNDVPADDSSTDAAVSGSPPIPSGVAVSERAAIGALAGIGRR